MSGKILSATSSMAPYIQWKTVAHESRYEIQKENIIRDAKAKPLGEGFYGIVYSATLKSESQRISVAVKEAKKTKPVQAEAIKAEIAILADIGEHEYILKFIGAVTKDETNVCLITELCELGSLDSFLQNKKDQHYIDEIVSTIYDNDLAKSFTEPTKYKAFRQQGWSAAYKSRRAQGRVTTSDLLAFGFQIASGMIFLQQKNIVHRDLALRNILLKDDYKIKIADFGLSRQTEENGVYIPKNQAGSRPYLPFRHSAPESSMGIYSLKSDWYTFGVLIWELFELGRKQPFANMTPTERQQFIDKGDKLEHPRRAPREIYESMKELWLRDPEDRMGFVECQRKFKLQLKAACPEAAKELGAYGDTKKRNKNNKKRRGGGPSSPGAAGPSTIVEMQSLIATSDNPPLPHPQAQPVVQCANYKDKFLRYLNIGDGGDNAHSSNRTSGAFDVVQFKDRINAILQPNYYIDALSYSLTKLKDASGNEAMEREIEAVLVRILYSCDVEHIADLTNQLSHKNLGTLNNFIKKEIIKNLTSNREHTKMMAAWAMNAHVAIRRFQHGVNNGNRSHLSTFFCRPPQKAIKIDIRIIMLTLLLIISMVIGYFTFNEYMSLSPTTSQAQAQKNITTSRLPPYRNHTKEEIIFAIVNMVSCLITSAFIIFDATCCHKWSFYQALMRTFFVFIAIMQIVIIIANGIFCVQMVHEQNPQFHHFTLYIFSTVLNFLSSGFFVYYLWKVQRDNNAAGRYSKVNTNTEIHGFAVSKATKSHSDTHTSFSFKKGDFVVIFAIGCDEFAHCFANGEIGYAPAECFKLAA